jgi:hypothetical protein
MIHELSAKFETLIQQFSSEKQLSSGPKGDAKWSAASTTGLRKQRYEQKTR